MPCVVAMDLVVSHELVSNFRGRIEFLNAFLVFRPLLEITT